MTSQIQGKGLKCLHQNLVVVIYNHLHFFFFFFTTYNGMLALTGTHVLTITARAILPSHLSSALQKNRLLPTQRATTTYSAGLKCRTLNILG
jgi:hypothetical protein